MALAAALLDPRRAAAQGAAGGIDSLLQAVVTDETSAQQLLIVLPFIDVPSGGMVLTPVYRIVVPTDLSMYKAAVEVVDDAGNAVPRDRLHHLVLTDLSRRELFLPLALPIFGASKESPNLALPSKLFGIPLPAAGRYIVGAMLANPDARPRRFQVRIRLSYIRPGRLFPIFRLYPWTMDVTYPLGGPGGRHDFDVPSGLSSRSWEGAPVIPGTIVAMGGHAHDYVRSIRFIDVTTGDTIWTGLPVLDDAGQLRAIPIGKFYRWYRLGVRIHPSHCYRVTVEYDNPTGDNIPDGGMGSVLGLIVPDRGARWPSVTPDDPTYRTQVANLLNNMAGIPLSPEGHMHSMEAAVPTE